MTGWSERISTALDRIRAAGRWRRISTYSDGPVRSVDTATGRELVAFASNDYLGLSHHPAVVDAARAALTAFGAGSGAARLIVGGRPPHAELEAELASWKGTDAALVFPTGYQANVGVLGALATVADDVLICSDELNHASVIDGARLARAEVAVYRHLDLGHLGSLLDAAAGRPVIVVSDSVFSMDGDLADKAGLADLCRSHDALLVLDEAHAVLGPPTPGTAVVVGTLSKTLGSLGGFVAASREVVDLCVNSARSFIFTTAPTPADTAASLAALSVLRSVEGEALVERLWRNVGELAAGHQSPIVPIHLGSEERAVEASRQLLDRGFLVPAIRPPTVAPGSSRLRVALSALHEPGQVARLRDALGELGLQVARPAGQAA